MEWLWITIGIILCLIGIAGSIFPVLPGPPLNYAALVILHITKIHHFSNKFLIGWLLVTVIVIVLDYIIPIYGAKLSGGSKKGIWGATIGLLVGIFFFPPFGLILWSFIGAIIGEIIDGKDIALSLKAGTGTFLGFLAGTIVKLLVSVIMTIQFLLVLF